MRGRFGPMRALVALTVTTAFLAATAGIVVEAPSRAAEPASATTLKAQAIYFQQKAKTADRDLAISSLATFSAWEGRLWSDFVTTWATINASMKMNPTVPDGLPAKGHVFVVLGSALKKSGAMSTKFERRLKLVVKALKKYPKAIVLVSGGAAKNGRTEAGVGYTWLRARGIAKSRILVEKKSSSTIGNAKYSMAMLAESARYTSYSLITDSSHLRRASVLFEAATVLVQEKSGREWPIQRLANVAYLDMPTAGQVPLSSGSVAYAAECVASLFGLSSRYAKVVDSPPGPTALTRLRLTAPTRVRYQVGDTLSTRGMVVKAVYNKGVYTRIVTDTATLAGFSSGKVSTGTVTASYADDDVTRSSTFSYTVVKATSDLRLDLSTTTPRRAKTRVFAKARVSGANGTVVPTGPVRFLLDGTRLKATRLEAGKPGVAVFTYPKIARKGTHRLVVKYAGDARFAPAREVVTVTVS